MKEASYNVDTRIQTKDNTESLLAKHGFTGFEVAEQDELVTKKVAVKKVASQQGNDIKITVNFVAATSGGLHSAKIEVPSLAQSFFNNDWSDGELKQNLIKAELCAYFEKPIGHIHSEANDKRKELGNEYGVNPI